MARAAFRIGPYFLAHAGRASDGHRFAPSRGKGAHRQYFKSALIAKDVGMPEDPAQSCKHLFHLIGHVGRMEPEMKDPALAGCGIQSLDGTLDSKRHGDEASDSV